MHVILVSVPHRSHKLLSLLEGFEVTRVGSLGELARLPRLVRCRSVVVVDTLGRYALLALAACVASWSPLVFRVRGPMFQEEREVRQARRGVQGWGRYLANTALALVCLRGARAVIYNSRYTRDVLGRHARARHTPIVHNPYTPPSGRCVAGVDLPDAGLRLFTATNMHAKSKMQALCDAICDWIPPSFWEESRARWFICGGGLHEERLRRLVAGRGLEEHIHVLGHVDYVPALYAWCDVFLNLTYLDAFPNSVMEAMMCGKPVVTNERSCGALEQVEHDVTGVVVEEGDAVVRALLAYAADPEMRRRHGEAGRELVERRFSVTVLSERLREALHSISV